MSDIVELHMKDLDRMENGVYSKLKDIGRMLLVLFH